MDFNSLIGRINSVQDALQSQAAHAVNLSLTARNWLIGYYIVEFEQNGEDRAKYGDNLLNRLSKILNCRGMEPRRLREFRQVYLVYPTLGYEIEAFLQKNNLFKPLILRSASAKLDEWQTSPTKLFNCLNFSSLLYLTSIEDPLKRAFYEQEAIRGCWTVKELDRQVSSLYFDRMGLSKDKLAMQKLSANNAQQLSPRDILHNPVTLEFLGLQSQDIFTETKLETAILNHIQQFLLEM